MWGSFNRDSAITSRTLERKDAEFVIVFNTPHYQQISLSQWLGANPAQLIADNFGITEETVKMLPKELIGIAKNNS